MKTIIALLSSIFILMGLSAYYDYEYRQPKYVFSYSNQVDHLFLNEPNYPGNIVLRVENDSSYQEIKITADSIYYNGKAISSDSLLIQALEQFLTN